MTEHQVGTRFVGRDRELGELVALLDASRSGRGHVVLLGGEPGIGKSRLADELASRAREAGHLVLWGRAWGDAGAPPYWPWVQALRGYLRATTGEDLQRHLGTGASDVVQLLPELRERFPDLEPPRDQGSDSARFQLFDSTTTLLRNAARAQPMLIVLDDLHAADTPSILLLRFIASQSSDMALTVVGTYRDIELTPDHPMTAALAEIGREPGARLLPLSGLPPDAVRQYVGATTDIKRQDRLVAAIWRATGGNPLFVGEAVRLLSAEGRLNDVEDLPSLRIAVPPGVRAVIARRIGHLSEETADLLRVGAALGPEFGLDVLRRVAGLSGDEALEQIDEAAQAGLLLPVTAAIGRYRFSHDLVRETLYDDLAPTRRVRLHARIASTLEAEYAVSVEPHLAELAFHFVEAVQHSSTSVEEGNDQDLAGKAIDYSVRAGDAAARSLAFEESARLYRMALSVLGQRPAADDGTRTEVLLALGEAQARAGDLDGAGQTYLEAAGIARRRGDGPHLARAALGYGGRYLFTRPGADTAMIPLLQDALVVLGGADDRLRLRLLSRLACAWRSSPERREDSDALSAQAVEIARGLNDLASLAYAVTGRFWATAWPENPVEREGHAREMIAIAEKLGDGERLSDAHLMLSVCLLELGRVSEAIAETATLTRIVEELRQPAQRWLARALRSFLALQSGDLAEADELIERELDTARSVSPAQDDLSAGRMHRFLLRRDQGRILEEEATLRASVQEFPWYPVHRAALAYLLVVSGREAEARPIFDDLAADEFRALYRDNEWLLGMALSSEVSVRLGDSQAAASLYRQLMPFAGRNAMGFPEGSVGAVDRYLGLLATTLGQQDDAERHFRDAIDFNERIGARSWLAHCRHDLAQLLRQRDAPGDRVEADRLDAPAKRVATELGMALAAEIVDRPAADAGRIAEPLTAGSFLREGEYWTVEFGGRTVRVRDSKGMQHLARLLRTPGQEIHSLDLASTTDAGRSESVRGGDADVASDAFGSAGPLLDAEAKEAYRSRLSDIRDELAEAERWNDPERAARLHEEERALTRELAGALGLGGRDRVAASPAERARVSVTRTIRAALARIAEEDPALGDHLNATIRTGTFCSYVPDPRAPITWRS